jgi:hypothetical protein
MNKTIFEKIISFAIQASSTDNMQFTKVIPSKDFSSCQITILEKKEGFIDYHYRASQISAGCFIENIHIASTHFGIIARIELDEINKSSSIAKVELDDSIDPLNIATIYFSKSTKESSKENEKLFTMIPKRNCNREAYTKEKISKKLLDSFLIMDNQNINMKYVSKNETTYSNIVDSLFACEKVRFYLKEGHKEFYDTIRYSKKEVETKRDGLDYKLLGLPPLVAKILMRALSNWKLASGIVKIGGVTMLSKTSSYDLLHKSQGLVVCTIKQNSKKHLIELGRKFQNTWLRITLENGSLQPFAPLPFFHYMIKNGAQNKFFKQQQETIISEYDKVHKLLHFSKDEEIALIFRLGIPKTLQYKSIRKDIKDIIYYS